MTIVIGTNKCLSDCIELSSLSNLQVASCKLLVANCTLLVANYTFQVTNIYTISSLKKEMEINLNVR